MVSHMSYYTGVLFEIYAENVGFPIGNGGRYDQLLGRFDSPAPATGFGIRTDRLLEALKPAEEQEKNRCRHLQHGTEKRGDQICRRRAKKGQKSRYTGLSGNRRY